MININNASSAYAAHNPAIFQAYLMALADASRQQANNSVNSTTVPASSSDGSDTGIFRF